MKALGNLQRNAWKILIKTTTVKQNKKQQWQFNKITKLVSSE